MRKDELFGGREQKSLNVLKSSVDYVLGEIKPTLDESLKAESVVNDSLGVINNSDVNTTYSAFDNVNNFDVNSNNMDNSSFSQGQSESRAKVRVLTPNNSPAIRDNVNVGSNFADDRNYGSAVSYNANSTNFVNNSKQAGSAQTLILIYTAILVVMVIAVSLVIMKSLGI